MAFELNHLKYFYYTALEGGVARAADRLCVQQPVVSKMLKTLEESLDTPLFYKSGRTKKMTDAGQMLFRHCQVIFTEADKISRMGKGSSEVAGPLNIGGAEPIVSHLLQNPLERLRQSYPGIHPNVYCGTSTQILQQLSLNRLELAFLFYAPKLDRHLELLDSMDFDFELVISAKHQKERSVLESFIGSREIDDSSSHRFPTLEKVRKKYPNCEIKISTNHIELHRKLVLAGQGISIMPAFLVENDLKKGKLVRVLPREKFQFPLKVIKPKATPLSLGAEQLLLRMK